jgi:hypothetical protein
MKAMHTSQAEGSDPRIPSPLSYHRALVGHLKAEEPDLWKWFCSTKRREGHAEAVRLDLLKSTYRLEAGTQPKLYSAAEEVLGKYDLKVPVTFYQAQTGTGMNAALAYLPGEAHIILSGPIQTALSEVELLAVLGHELAHFIFFDKWEGEFLAATELLEALCNDAAAAPVHVETARLFLALRFGHVADADVGDGATWLPAQFGAAEIDTRQGRAECSLIG